MCECRSCYEGSHHVQTHSNVLWKLAAMLIDRYCEQLRLSAGIKAQLIQLYPVPYCTDCHTDPLCGLQKRWP